MAGFESGLGEFIGDSAKRVDQQRERFAAERKAARAFWTGRGWCIQKEAQEAEAAAHFGLRQAG